jgi:hypothetical protein
VGFLDMFRRAPLKDLHDGAISGTHDVSSSVRHKLLGLKDLQMFSHGSQELLLFTSFRLVGNDNETPHYWTLQFLYPNAIVTQSVPETVITHQP